MLTIIQMPEFRSPDFNDLKLKLKDKVIFDGRNIYEADELRSLGFTYYGIGVK
jgi:UDPglucose 6-dehydrogenase